MEIGIFGLPLCGKTTLFTLLTGVEPSTSSRKVEAGVGVARVHDPRVEQLSRIFRPRKTIYASLTFVDLPSYDPAANRKEKNRILQFIQNSDALLAVVRAFADPAVPWPVGGEGPARQLASIKTELLLRDMEVVEGRLARLDEGLQKHRLTPEEERERVVLQRVQQALEEEQPVSRLQLAEEESRLLGSLALFTAKPVIVAVNMDEQQFEAHAFPEEDAVRDLCRENGFALIELSGKVEAEIAALDPADRESFMEVLGITESGIERLSAVVYDHVGLISFLTVGEDEVRAWTIKRDTTAKGAAGKIHTDLEKHFIRAEIIPYTTFMEVGDLPAARSRGLIKTVGRDEIVRDGDIVNILANA
ncbi:MAG: DUF933 domain-containing protein [Anaerolineae bacterium]